MNDNGESDEWISSELDSLEGVDPRLTNSVENLIVPTSEELGLSESLLDKKNRTLQKTEQNQRSSRYVFKRDGLVKRTISGKVDGHWQHLVCYYSRTDFASVLAGPPISDSLFAPELMSELRTVRVPIDLVIQQNFRRPPLLTASSGQKEVPLTAAPRPRRASTGSLHHQSSNGNEPTSTSSSTPIPIITHLDNMIPDIVTECVNNALSSSMMSNHENINEANHDDINGRLWTMDQTIKIVSDEDDGWGGCFLKGTDPSLASFSSE